MKAVHAVLILVVLFSAVSAVSWHTWANPVIDSGREMNTPLRLLRGEQLYSEVYYLYGPVTPYFNAFLYKIFGIHLTVLYAAGLAGSLLLILAVFYLARWFMTAYEALLAGVAVILFSTFKEGGTLIFPYSFAALYGTLLGTVALIAQVDFMRSRRKASLYAAGALAGLALCCKFEFGIAATASLIALIFSTPRELRGNVARISLMPLAAIPLVIYGLLLARIPAEALFVDTFFLPGYIPDALVYFNRMKLGLNHPGRTLREALNAIALLGCCGGAALLAGVRMTGTSIAFTKAKPHIRRLWLIVLVCGGLILLHLLIFGTRWDLNPLRALPVLFLGTIWFCLKPPERKDETDALKRPLLVVSVFSLVVLARVAIRVPAGGAYGAGFLPVPLMLFIFIATAFLPVFSPSPEAGYRTRRALTRLITVAFLSALVVFSIRMNRFEYVITTPRGSMRQPPALGVAIDQALKFIAQNSKPEDYILALPEGSSLNFLADRRAPLRYEIVTPGFLTEAAERQSIRSLQEKNVRYIFLFNRSTEEFGANIIGQDYCRILMGWIEANYKQVAVFGEGADLDAEVGDTNFFIKCYARR